MSPWIAWPLMLLFAAHLAGFAALGLKRRESYYLALVVTFTLLTAAFAVALVAPEWTIGNLAAFRLLRYGAWGAAAVSISWTALRMLARRRG
jgi:uncharacterized membrane protein